MLATETLLCTRRRYCDPTIGHPQDCPGAVGFCESCPHVPAVAKCRTCERPTDLTDVEHANRVTGGWGCGRADCPPPSRLDTLMGGGG